MGKGEGQYALSSEWVSLKPPRGSNKSSRRSKSHWPDAGEGGFHSIWWTDVQCLSSHEQGSAVPRWYYVQRSSATNNMKWVSQILCLYFRNIMKGTNNSEIFLKIPLCSFAQTSFTPQGYSHSQLPFWAVSSAPSLGCLPFPLPTLSCCLSWLILSPSPLLTTSQAFLSLYVLYWCSSTNLKIIASFWHVFFSPLRS